MRLLAQSNYTVRLFLALILVLVSSLSLDVVSQHLEDDADETNKESGAWYSTGIAESQSELEIKEEQKGEIDIGTLLEFYKEFHRPTRDEEYEEDEDGSRFSLFGIVGRIQNKMRPARNFPRSILYDCPNKPAKHDPYRRSKMLYYNPEDQLTHKVEETRDGGWMPGDIEYLLERGLNLSKPTVAIMGGYLQTSQSKWIVMFKKRVSEISMKGLPNGRDGAPFNLLIYDWAAYSLDFYEQSVSFVPHMANVLAKFFELLIDNHGYKLSQIQLVGFSLSTHIIGNAGRQLKTKYAKPISIIHALDPTGVCFHDRRQENNQFAREFALRPTDAKLVLARHYNMNQLGAGRFIGGVDIVVNDGKTQPVMFPERVTMRTILASAGIFIASHMRATEHETTHVPDYNSQCHEIAYECSSYEAFNAGECGHCRAHNQSCFHISTLGNFGMGQRPAEFSNLKPGTIMFVTTGRSTYCEHTFQVVVRLDEPSANTISEFKSGKFRLIIGQVEINPINYVAGKQMVLFTQLLRNGRMPLPFPMEVQVDESVRPLIKSIKYVTLTHMSHILHATRRKNSVKYCRYKSSDAILVKCK